MITTVKRSFPSSVAVFVGLLAASSLLTVSACLREQPVELREILARPSGFTDTIIVVEGTLTSGARIPATNIGVHYLVDSRRDSILFIVSPDTFPVGKRIRVAGRIHVKDFPGVARLGPFFVAGDVTRAIEAALLRAMSIRRGSR